MKIFTYKQLLSQLFNLDKVRLDGLILKGQAPKRDLFIRHENDLKSANSTPLDVKSVMSLLKRNFSPILIDSCGSCDYHVVIEESLTLIQHHEKVFLIPISTAVTIANKMKDDDNEMTIEPLNYDDNVCSMGHYQTEGYWDMYKRMHFVINNTNGLLFAFVDEHPTSRRGGLSNGK